MTLRILLSLISVVAVSAGHLQVHAPPRMMRKENKEHRQFTQNSHADVVEVSKSSASTLPREGEAKKSELESAGLLEQQSAAAAALMAEMNEDSRMVMKGWSEKKTEAEVEASKKFQRDAGVKTLSDEDEALYRKLFPEEDRDAEVKDSVASLMQTEKKKAFRIKVPMSSGRRLCLTEDNFGYKIRAEPCRRHSHRQKWYWIGNKLKNLFSNRRCLGYTEYKHHIYHQSESLLEQEQKQKEAILKGHHLSMEFECEDSRAPLAWTIDEQGRLKSSVNNQCMATKDYHGDVVILPCEKNGVREAVGTPQSLL